mmetsp:Transcript_4359/g.10681  ORF Transcript_4359/g.10681 Transcript_4359/m.10681 type:complete len:208 (-) Transcript_4359:140-763(-)
MDNALLNIATSLVLGTFMGLLFFLISGLGKLLPSHPMYSTLKAEFDKLVGPYLGWPATLLRLVLGLAEVAAGLALLMIIWGEELGMLTDAKVAAIAHAILFCSLAGLITLIAGAGCFHALVEGRMAGVPYVVLDVMLISVGAARIGMGDMEKMPRTYQYRIYGFALVCLAGFPLSQCWACVFGISKEEARRRDGEVEQLKQQFLCKA